MPKIVTVEQMRAIEKASDAKGHTYADMMALAGRAVAQRVMTLLYGVAEPRIAILAGPGNNGGDGLVAGRLLAQELSDASVGVFLLQPRDAEKDPVFAAAQEAGLFIADAENDSAQGYRVLQNMVANADVVIDALFGTSVRLPIKGDAAKVLQAAHKALNGRRAEASRPYYTTPTAPDDADRMPWPLVVAVDVPSGLDPDTGELDKATIHATETITFAAAKPGQLTFPGADAVGLLHVADIGLPERLPELDDAELLLIDAQEVGARLPQRPANSHKGTFGKAMVVAGSLNYIGAPYMAASGAYRAGAGLVTVGAPQIIVPALASMLPEATWILLPHDMGVINQAAVKVLRKELGDYDALLLGPGFGREDTTCEFLRDLLQPREERRPERTIGFVHAADAEAEEENASPVPPLVIDADGLNLLATIEDWPALLPPNTVITPHPGEFGRLAQMDAADVQADRIALARDKAADWGCVVVLKGAFTVVAAPDGRAAVSPFASAGLARAGTGDVLAGAITGLLAQGLEPFDAALCAVWLHGMAGTRAVELTRTTASTMATDLLELLPDAFYLAEATRR